MAKTFTRIVEEALIKPSSSQWSKLTSLCVREAPQAIVLPLMALPSLTRAALHAIEYHPHDPCNLGIVGWPKGLPKSRVTDVEIHHSADDDLGMMEYGRFANSEKNSSLVTSLYVSGVCFYRHDFELIFLKTQAKDAEYIASKILIEFVLGEEIASNTKGPCLFKYIPYFEATHFLRIPYPDAPKDNWLT